MISFKKIFYLGDHTIVGLGSGIMIGQNFGMLGLIICTIGNTILFNYINFKHDINNRTNKKNI